MEEKPTSFLLGIILMMHEYDENVNSSARSYDDTNNDLLMIWHSFADILLLFMLDIFSILLPSDNSFLIFSFSSFARSYNHETRDILII
jgi:hypothetical protein